MNKITVVIEVPSEEQEHVAQMLSSSINRIIFNDPNVKVRSQALFGASVGNKKRPASVSQSIADASSRYSPQWFSIGTLQNNSDAQQTLN
jgi:hypothetical protein